MLVISAPVLFTVMPPPVSVIPVTVNSAAVFVRLMPPLVLFVALKVPTELAPLKV